MLSCFEITDLAVPHYMFQQKSFLSTKSVWCMVLFVFSLAGGLVGCPFNFVVSPPDVNSALLSVASTVGTEELPGTAPLAAAPVCGWACLWFTGTSSCSYRGKSGTNTFLECSAIQHITPL